MFLEKNICDIFLSLCTKDIEVYKSHFKIHYSKKRDSTDIEKKIYETYAVHDKSLSTIYYEYQSLEFNKKIPKEFYDYYNFVEEKCYIKILKMPPGNFMIPHYDNYSGLKNPDADASRLWISLTEPKFGHLLIIDDRVFHMVKQGTVTRFEKNELHFSANLGYEDRYVMLITG